MGKVKMFKKLCKMDQADLKAYMTKVLVANYKEVEIGDGYVYAKGNDIALTAHMDTVHKEVCRDIITVKHNGKTIMSSPQGIGGDDRCGIWMIYQIVTETKYRPTIILCEEIGGVGSNKFVNNENLVKHLSEMKYILELDRKGSDDAVYYDCGNEEFQEYIEKEIEYKVEYGSFSDIGHLSPATDLASVNLSCGYYKQHTLDEYVVYEEMNHTLQMVKHLLKVAPNAKRYDYQEVVYKYTTGGNWWDNYYSNSYLSKYDLEDYMFEVIFMRKDNMLSEEYIASSMEEAIGKWILDYSDCKGDDLMLIINEDTNETQEFNMSLSGVEEVM